jgi:hypothetical protein
LFPRDGDVGRGINERDSIFIPTSALRGGVAFAPFPEPE